MIDTPFIRRENPPVGPAVPGQNGWPPLWRRLALAVVMLISIFMNFYQLGQNGFGNLYYAAAIRSMLDSWHNFFFVSFDPGGFVSIDKPPLGFWLQAASAKVFGFTPFGTTQLAYCNLIISPGRMESFFGTRIGKGKRMW
jgi:hypothetical protein